MSDFDAMQIADSATMLAESYGGMRAAIIANGFTPEQAGDIVVAVVQQAAADSLARAFGRDEK